MRGEGVVSVPMAFQRLAWFGSHHFAGQPMLLSLCGLSRCGHVLLKYNISGQGSGILSPMRIQKRGFT